LQDGTLATKNYFNQLLRLVYRLIFLLTVEERGLLHPDNSNEKARTLYAQGYSVRRLRDRAVNAALMIAFPTFGNHSKSYLLR